MKDQFRYQTFRKKTLQLLNIVCQIIEKYDAQDIQLTLRQLYYQLVAGSHIPNTQAWYGKLSRDITNARYNGIIDWDAIVDRVRIPNIPAEWSSIDSILKSAMYSYRLPRWNGQDYYVELFVEKDALASVIEPVTTEFHVPFCINRGYASATALHDAADRIKSYQIRNPEVTPVILYFGDHDPSGLDMVRDITDRVAEFNIDDLIVERVALTWVQIQEHNLPPNPAKMTDTRAKEYIAKYGHESWELDALPAEVLRKLVKQAIYNYVDLEKMDVIITKENTDKEELQEWINSRNNN